MRSPLTKVRVLFRATAEQPCPAATQQDAEHEVAGEIEEPLASDGRAGESPYGPDGQASSSPRFNRRTKP